MGDRSLIEWTDRTWNPVTGCTKVSPGCERCYAERITERFHGTGAFARVRVHPERIPAPLRWRRRSRVFVNSMADLFHDQVPDEVITRVFAVMAATPRHTYQVLTKRHGRMRALLRRYEFQREVQVRAARIGNRGSTAASGVDHDCDAACITWTARAHPHRDDEGNPHTRASCDRCAIPAPTWPMTGWPLPNVWLGVSVEDQKRAELRIPALLDTPATVRFLSCEPLLGPVDLTRWLKHPQRACDYCHRRGPLDWRSPHLWGACPCACHPPRPVRLDWVIVGGESGPGARPMHPGWARGLRDVCQVAGVAFFFKQWGQYAPHAAGLAGPAVLVDPHGTAHTPRPDTPYRPGWVWMTRAGKKATGRVLDGRTWDQFPHQEVSTP